MIVITNPTTVPNEMEIINSLFENGLELLHIRKPDFSEIKTALFIHQIKKKFRAKLVLHNHHQLIDKFEITRIHFSEKERKANKPNPFLKPVRFTTSTHSIEDFNNLSDDYNYAFLSPVFSSISKENYHPQTDLLEAAKSRTNFKTKLIALGGIESKNINQILQAGFDDVALLGTIWNSNNALENFKLCQQIVHSY
ncbi:thiamine phosphate synthase [Flavobacterium sp.]|uniref:thiamine phosphate synthase n=1 Tax=Flavobacterium sp. TaxID=239 RepID=UPI002B6DE1D3|nr:thiamine phosphate synthase [Flavobacterium sp.]HSD06264.1 thiamine phosphate synthase [Flavobacterium sp.]